MQIFSSNQLGLFFAIAFLFLCQGCDNSNAYALSKKVPDTGPLFVLDETQPFRIELGRGSGWYGLDTIEINNSAEVLVYRQTRSGWETTTFTLTPTELNSITKALDRHQVFKLARAYHADVSDGTQWVFRTTQNSQSKTIYCNNYFPDSLLNFASRLDEVLDLANRSLTWTPVPIDHECDHEKDLWDSI